MQTQLMQPGKTDVPCFERSSTDGQQVERTPIQSVPFSIGRIDTADLQIDSGRVSREHAVVVKEGKSYRLRDLGSTNGTLVNGQQIDEVELTDGDIVVIADQQFVFVAAAGDGARRMATQVMAEEQAADPFDRVLAMRRLQESLLHRGFRPGLKKIYDLDNGNTLGYASQSWDAAHQHDKSDWLSSPFSSSTWQACQLHRALAAEAFLELGQHEMLLLAVDAEEIEGNDSLTSQLSQLRSSVGDEALVVSLPACVFDVDEHPLLVALAQSGFLTAHANFVGSRAQISRLAESPPDYLLLSPAMTRDLHGARQRKQLAAIPDACEKIGTRAIVCDLATREDEDACRELGFQLAISRRDIRLGTTASKQLLAV